MHSQAHDVSAPSLLETLRTGTGLLHVALEQRLPFFSERLDAQWYRRLLQAYHGFYQPMEAALYDSGLIPDGYESALRVKTPTLVHDLHALGLTEHAIHALPRCTQLPVLDTPAACLGALYVLEGATLGWVRDLLLDPSQDRGLFNPAMLDQLLTNPQGQLTPLRGSKLWQLAALNLWLSEQGL